MQISDYQRGLIVERRTHRIKRSGLKGLKGITVSPPKALQRKASNQYALVLWDGEIRPKLVAVRVLQVIPRSIASIVG